MNLLLVFLLCFNHSGQENNATHNNSGDLPDKISSLPVGINVKHNRKRVLAELNTSKPQRGAKYKWNYETSVESLNDSLTIIEFGAFLLNDGKWVEKTIYGRPFNKEEFEKWYSCQDALLTTGKKFYDKNNWNSASNLNNAGSKTLWYYIGVDKNKKKYVGYKIIKTVSKLSE